jgi:hypothetical protein
MESIPDNERKYDVYLWEVHTMTMGSTHTVDGKYIASTLGSAKSQRSTNVQFWKCVFHIKVLEI